MKHLGIAQLVCTQIPLLVAPGLIVSAHWESAPLTLSASAAGTPLVYDFGGFHHCSSRSVLPAMRTARSA